MKNMMLGIISAIIIIVLVLPVTASQSCRTGSNTGSLVKEISIHLSRYDNDGRLVFNISNGNEDIDNLTMNVSFVGSGHFSKFNAIDMRTTVFIQHLPAQSWQRLKTTDPVFRVWKIVNKPLILRGVYLMNISIDTSYRMSKVIAGPNGRLAEQILPQAN